MDVIEYHPMLRHDHSTAGAASQCCVGSPPARSGAVVQAGPVAGGGHAEARGQSADGASVVSPLAPARPAGLESGGAAGSQTAAQYPAAGAGRAGTAPGAAAARLPHRSVDAAARGHGDRAPDRRALSCRPCLVHPARAALVVATPGPPGARARRAGHPAHLGAARPDPGPDPHGRPLATALGGWGAGLPLGWAPDPLLFPDVSRHRYGGDPHPVSAPPETALPRPPRDPDLGWLGRPPKPCDARLSGSPTPLAPRRTPARLCPGVESHRTGLGQRQGARDGQCVRARADRTAPAFAYRLGPRASPIQPRSRLPAAYRTPALT